MHYAVLTSFKLFKQIARQHSRHKTFLPQLAA